MAWGSVLVFVTRKVQSEDVATMLRAEGHKGEWVQSLMNGSGRWVWCLFIVHLD